MFGIPVHACTCKNDEYFRSIISDSVVTCDEIREPTKKQQSLLIKTLHFK